MNTDWGEVGNRLWKEIKLPAVRIVFEFGQTLLNQRFKKCVGTKNFTGYSVVNDLF